MRHRQVGIWLGGLALGIFLMVADELLSLSLYCGLRCDYPIPFLGSFSIWDAWGLTFTCIVLSVIFTFLLIGEKQ